MSGALDLKPAFQAEKLEGEFTRTVMCIEEDIRKVGPNQDKSLIIRKLVPRQEKYEGAYMIYFPQGHSMFVAADDVDQLQRIGVLEQPMMIDMNSGEVVPAQFTMSPKELVEAKTKAKYRPRSTGGLETLEGERIE